MAPNPALARWLHRRAVVPLVVLLLALVTMVVVAPASPAAAAAGGWPAYLFGPLHGSDNAAATTITPSNASTLGVDWTWSPPPPTQAGQPPNALYASPTVGGGRVYIGADTGVFYALHEGTGTVAWHRFLGFDSARSCPYARGVISTAALGTDPATGTRAVYVGGGDGYLYALRASDGKIIWRAHVVQTGTTTQNAGYLWSSPLVIGGRVYMGVSSDCDVPLIRGGLKVFSQRTGRFLHTYWAVPRGTVGGSVWTSPASDGRSVWITTGNADPAASQPGDSFSMVRLAPSTLSRLQKWTVPNLAGTDLDWGSSPTLFSARVGGVATPMVGACNKNGVFYAFRANHLYAGPLWSRQIGTAPGPHRGMCLGAAVWDQADHRLIVGSNLTTVSGTSSPGAVRALSPATGHVAWETGTPAGPIQGSPSSDGGGVVAAATFDLQTNQNVLYLLNGSSGDVVGTKTIGSPEFAQPVFADDHLFVATVDAGLTAFMAP